MSDETGLRDAVRDLRGSIDQLRSELVRKDVYDSDQRGIAQRLDGLRDDVLDLERKFDKAEERRAADRRLILTAVVVPLLLFIVQLYITAQLGGTP